MPVKPKITKRSQIYVFKQGAWILSSERSYRWDLDFDEFCRAWLAHVEKHPQSTIRHPLHPDDHTDLSCASEV